MSWFILLLIVALILFILAGISVPAGRYGLGWIACALVLLAFLLRSGVLPPP